MFQSRSHHNLKNPEEYTGNRLRRRSATILLEGGEELLIQKRHGGWRSLTVVEVYVEDSMHHSFTQTVQ